MRKKIKKTIFFLLIIITLIAGFFKIKDYIMIKVEQDYGDCTIKCNKEYDDSRGKLETSEDGKIEKSLLAGLTLKYESCLDVCVADYKKITGKEIKPLYEILKEQWNLDTSSQ